MLLLNSRPQTQEAIDNERELEKKHSQYLAMLEIFWHQRSRVCWAQFGDRNTNFFHTAAVIRHRRNLIIAIQKEDGTWETSERGIKQLFLNHYREIYGGSSCRPIVEVMPAFLLAQLPKIPNLVHNSLTAAPTEAEVVKALLSLGPDKAPGPDGVNARLIQQHWEIFGAAVMGQVNNFFLNNQLPSTIARSNLILVPKLKTQVRSLILDPSLCAMSYTK